MALRPTYRIDSNRGARAGCQKITLILNGCLSNEKDKPLAPGPHDFTQGRCDSRRSVQELGFTEIGLLTPLCRLYPLPVRQASALPRASSGFRLTTDTLAIQLTLPLAGCVEDSHLQVSAPCRAHQSNGREDRFPAEVETTS